MKHLTAAIKYTVLLAIISLFATSCSSGYRSVKYKCNSIGCYSNVDKVTSIHSTQLIVRIDEVSDAE